MEVMTGELICSGAFTAGVSVALVMDVYLGVVAYRALRGRN
jgi:hypothetical protein